MTKPRQRCATGCGESGLGALKVATYGVLASLALVLGWVEALFPLPVPVPGIKLGLGNIVVLYALACLGGRAAFAIMLVKVVASSLLFGNPSIFLYSMAGAVLSLALMTLAIRWKALSLVGVSMVGGVGHMAGQLAVVALVLTPGIAAAYAPILIVVGLVTGVLVGLLCRLVIHATRTSQVVRDRRKQLALAARRSAREKG